MKTNKRKSRISDETKVYKNNELNNEKPNTKKRSNKKPKPKKPKSKLKKAIIIILIVILIVLIVKFFISYFSWKKMAEAMILNEASTIVDADGKSIGTIGNYKIKENVSIGDIPNDLKNAYVSIEDQRFYKHGGIDIKRTGGAIITYITHFGSSSFGGSTITQQLVKNLTGDSSSTISRKTTEWVKAIELETFLSKDEILEAYLNVIYVGPNTYGVASGSKYYFNKNVSDLSLAECAFLAGINNAPNVYNPFGETDKSEKIKTRTKTVLNKMLELKHIDEKACNKAIKEVEKGLAFSKGELQPKGDNVYSYHTEAAISEAVKDLSKEKHISKSCATNYLEMGGLTIHSTQKTDIQARMEEEFKKNTYILYSKNGTDTSQAAMVIMNQSTGYVVGCTGGLGEKTSNRGLNRATQSLRQTGSAIKPIAVLAPSIQEKILTAADMFNDELTTFDDGSEEGYTPTNYNNYLGNITVRQAVESSQNIPFVSMMEDLTPKKSIKYLKKLGITSLTPEDENLALALGGLQKGFSPLEMAAAYATLANEGVYIEPTFYTLIENSKGKKVLKTKQESHKVFSKATAFVITELLNQPVNGTYGTAKYCALDGIEVAAKTGTTNNNYDRWLCEYTPYYTAVTWYGFDLNETINFNGSNPAGLLSARIMADIHSKLDNKSFEMPSGVVMENICSETGLIANSGCSNIYAEYFLSKTAPDSCTKHSGSKTTSPTKNNTNKNPEVNLNDDSIFKDIEVPEDTYNKNNSSNPTTTNTQNKPPEQTPTQPTTPEPEENTNSTPPETTSNNTTNSEQTENTTPETPTPDTNQIDNSTSDSNDTNDTNETQ